MTFFLPVYTLSKRELIRFLRQKSRIIGVVGSPLLFWLLIGSGIGTTFKIPGAKETEGYLEYFFPGTVLLVVLFTSIFASISTIEDRREGFLQSVLVSPARRSSIVLGKILGITILATLQGTMFILLAPFAGVSLTFGTFISTVLTIILISFGLAALGFLFAWRLDSTQGFHAIMNLVFVPMWMLSGSLFPTSGASSWIALIMQCNPLSYMLDMLRHILYWNNDMRKISLNPFGISFLVTHIFAATMFILCVILAKKK
ncbi:MAG: multidrug ABC transporter permease [Ignavibacteria bacterium]|nr:multidrug ABC transporter permease [Ignavibacteria bacterium]